MTGQRSRSLPGRRLATGTRTWSSPVPLAPLIVLLVFASGGNALAQAGAGQATPTERPDATVTVAAGMLLPANGTVKEMYGSALLHPLVLQAEIPLALDGRLSALAAWKYLRTAGETIVTGPQVADERYPLQLTMSSLRFGGLALLSRRPHLLFTAGGALTYNLYSERWKDQALTTSGRSWGVVGQAGANYLLGSRYLILGRVEVASVPTHVDTSGEETPNLGGVSFDAGFGIRF